MIFKSDFKLDFNKLNNLYFNLLSNEDFDFKTKNINIIIKKLDSGIIHIFFESNSVIDLKIAVNAIIKSIEIINKSNEI